MEKTFYFTLKALFVLKIFKFLSWLFGHVKKSLIRGINFKIYDVTNWKTIYILTKISKSKGNQTMRFGQLVEYKMRNIFFFFLKYHTQNLVNDLFLDPFLKKQNWTYLWIDSLKSYIVRFYCMLSWRLSKYIETQVQTYLT